MIQDAAIVVGLLVTAYFVQHFQDRWVGDEYRAATLLKVNRRRTTAVFSLAFLASIMVFAGTVFTALEMSALNGAAFNVALLLYMAFFMLLNRLVKKRDGGEA